jgi:L-alanine-DL-glutamate epimerase-like enolase superfamily enzyme
LPLPRITVSKATDIRLVDVTTRTEKFAYRAPIKFGGRVVTDVTLFHMTVTVETRDGRRATGFGSMPVGAVWAWPSQRVSAVDAETAMIAHSERMAQVARKYTGVGHPLEITHELSHDYAPQAAEVIKALGLAEPMPKLAQMVSASPLESAIHDAYGRALGLNSYNVLSAEFVNRDIGSYLTPEFAGEYLDRYTLREPKARMPLYHLVGALDPLTDADVTQRINDGYPQTLPEWIAYNGLTHLKIKLNGDDLAWDVERVVRVESTAVPAQAARGCKEWHYSLDFNEKCANVEYLLDFIARVKERSPQAFERVQYIEQPTHRDLKSHPENKMHAVAKIKPVVIDESLVDFESLLLCREQGYSGVALKACKGQTEALLMGAAAQKYGMFLCVQDLSCPGWSFLHSASISARLPTIAAIEGNSRQYCPSANDGWRERYPTMFKVTDGMLGTAALNGVGLGFDWVETK